MNKILIDKEEVVLEKITKKLKISSTSRTSEFGITKIVIDVYKSCALELKYIIDNSKIDILFNIEPNVSFDLYEYKTGDKVKIQYTYNISKNSSVNINKFNKASNIKEMIIVNLNEEKANINYNFKSISTSKEIYDVIVNHNVKETTSNIKNKSVCLEDGKISFQVSGYVDNGIKNCIINQSNHIINLTNNKCEIRPNLYVNEYDTEANHSALIGGFDKEELFYLQSRGINEIDAKKLLIRGFLLSDLYDKKMMKEIEKNIKEYWR